MPIMQTVIQGGGTTPTGTKSITTNGVHDVTNYASADVQVPTSGPAYYVEKTLNANDELCTSTNIINLTGVTKLGSYVLSNAYRGVAFPNNTNVDFSTIKALGEYALYYCFRDTSGITSVDLTSLVALNANAKYCLSNTFSGTSVTTVNFASLAQVYADYGFSSCFNNCSKLVSLYFPSLNSWSFLKTTVFNSMLSNVTGCTVHFPSNVQSLIDSWSSVTSGFGGTNTTVLFDLPATIKITTTNSDFYRTPKYDTATSFAWKRAMYTSMLIEPDAYTSGLSNPVVGDTVYSDAACTMPFTTITSIS